MNPKTIKEKVEWYSLLNKQNLNGRETEDELFEAGILVGIEETEELRDDFAIDFAEWVSCKYKKLDNKNWFSTTYQLEMGIFLSSKELLEIFKKEKGYE